MKYKCSRRSVIYDNQYAVQSDDWRTGAWRHSHTSLHFGSPNTNKQTNNVISNHQLPYCVNICSPQLKQNRQWEIWPRIYCRLSLPTRSAVGCGISPWCCTRPPPSFRLILRLPNTSTSTNNINARHHILQTYPSENKRLLLLLLLLHLCSAADCWVTSRSCWNRAGRCTVMNIN